MPGGRPRNCWRPDRERKLTRLYMLSNLNLDEIQKVLRANGFDPSTSDMQKKLRALLPKDYAKDYRRYRPSSDQNARRRLFHVKFCTGDRAGKFRGLHSRSAVNQGTANTNTPPHERRASAFRYYSYSTSSESGNYISMPRLDLSNIHFDLESPPESYAVDCTQRVHSLHRDAVLGTTTDQGEMQCTSPILSIMSIKSNQMTTTPINNSSETGLREYQGIWQREFFPADDMSGTGYEVNTLSDSLSIRSLGRRLVRRCSRSTLEHIASILRSSSPSSRRSSLLSLPSFGSSKVSSKMSLDQTSRTTEKRADETAPHGTQFVLRRGKLLLTDDEQNIWEDLIDESQLSQPSREIPLYPEISLLKRPCCEMKVSSSCTRCGFSEVHCWAVTAVTEPYVAVPFPSSFSADFKNERDYFGNTPLHFAAANATGSITTGWRTIKWLIHKGANVGARNTSGETFMHVLHRELLKCTERYSELLLLLAKLSFPFSQRDHHGQTLAEIFFATVNPQDIQLGHFRIIFSHLLFDIHEKYVTDFWARTVGDNETLQESRCVGARNLASLVAQGYKPLPSFQNANFWSTGPDLSDIGKGIDVNGNSALIYIVKAWREAHDDRQLSHILKSLVSAGADIAMRDRHGDTALAVAARRGLRPAVKTLLCCGANPNTRNYRGRGVLEGAREGLKRARKEDKSRRYAMAVSCVALLVDYGAVEQPTAYDEFVSPTARAKVQGAPGFV